MYQIKVFQWWTSYYCSCRCSKMQRCLCKFGFSHFHNSSIRCLVFSNILCYEVKRSKEVTSLHRAINHIAKRWCEVLFREWLEWTFMFVFFWLTASSVRLVVSRQRVVACSTFWNCLAINFFLFFLMSVCEGITSLINISISNIIAIFDSVWDLFKLWFKPIQIHRLVAGGGIKDW